MNSQELRTLGAILFKGDVSQVLTRTATNAFGFSWQDATGGGGGGLTLDLDEGDSATGYGASGTVLDFDEGAA